LSFFMEEALNSSRTCYSLLHKFRFLIASRLCGVNFDHFYGELHFFLRPAKQLSRTCREVFFILILIHDIIYDAANYAANRLPRRDYTIVWVIGLNPDCREVSDYSFVINDFIYDAAKQLPRSKYKFVILWL
jgi:hypothetical protein